MSKDSWDGVELEGQLSIFDLKPFTDYRGKYNLELPSKRWIEEDGYIDIWHYTDEEEPEEIDVYWSYRLSFQKYDNGGYSAWAKGKWWYWDNWLKEWKECNKNHVVIAFMKIPTIQRRKDVALQEMLGLRGII